MSKLVVDASVAAKWLVTEPLSDKALDVLGSSDDLCAPDLLLAEVGNILWKKARAGDLAPAAAQERFRALLSMGVTLVPASGLGERAVALALELGERSTIRFTSRSPRRKAATSSRPMSAWSTRLLTPDHRMRQVVGRALSAR